ncbi:MAG TPA: tetratricopeptide repeat protein [Verrucomicrobiae bacterium]|nr:tetratricopeptide repeat protein [Verrucomicrobiae bacterium]
MNRRSVWLAGAALVLITGAIYSFAFPGQFHLDDAEYITRNPLITGGRGLQPLWFSTAPKDYYPLTFTVLWLEWHLWGGHAAGYLTVNILLQACNVLLLWLVLRRFNLAGAWLAALLFAVHPLNVATVAWLSQLKSVLAMSFALLVVLADRRFDETRQPGWYMTALVLFLLALLSKSAVVALPVVLLLLNAWRRGKFVRTDVIRYAPYFALSIVFGLVTIWFQSHRVLEASPVRQIRFVARTGDAACALWFYVSKALLPVNLMLVYPNWTSPQPGTWQMLAVAGGIIIAIVLWRFRQWGVLVALGCYVAMLLPVLGFFDQGFYVFSLVADHWQYFALPALLVLPAELLVKSRRTAWRGALPITVTAVGALLLTSVGRASLFSNAESLWRDSVARNPGSWVTHFNLGLALKEQGRIGEAIACYRQALRLNPNDVKSHNNLGNALLERDQLGEALAQFREAIRLKPDLPAAHNNLGVTLARMGRLREAAAEFREAVRLDADYADARKNLARVRGILEAQKR